MLDFFSLENLLVFHHKGVCWKSYSALIGLEFFWRERCFAVVQTSVGNKKKD